MIDEESPIPDPDEPAGIGDQIARLQESLDAMASTWAEALHALKAAKLAMRRAAFDDTKARLASGEDPAEIRRRARADLMPDEADDDAFAGLMGAIDDAIAGRELDESDVAT